jgi:hypothetical protein
MALQLRMASTATTVSSPALLLIPKLIYHTAGNGNSFGAIGQPPQYNHQAGFISNNPYSMLDGGNGSQNSRSPKYEDEDDQVTYQPRHR